MPRMTAAIFEPGRQPVIIGAITPSGHSYVCPCGQPSQDGAGTRPGFKAIGGWKFGNTIDGCGAEFVLVPETASPNASPWRPHSAWTTPSISSREIRGLVPRLANEGVE
jgi:threonine dehydrogenase-like Zn-dependent dehydrogenase